MTLRASKILPLTTFGARDPSKIDRSHVRWSKELLESTLHTLWASRAGALEMKYNVYTHRLILALRARFDRKGYHLRTQTEITTGNVVIWITQKHKGNRPWKSR